MYETVAKSEETFVFNFVDSMIPNGVIFRLNCIDGFLRLSRNKIMKKLSKKLCGIKAKSFEKILAEKMSPETEMFN